MSSENRPVAWMWQYIGRDPMRDQIHPCARSLHEMDPHTPPYPDSWRPLHPLYARPAPSEPSDEPKCAGCGDYPHPNFACAEAAALRAPAEPSEPYPLPDDLYDSKDWRAGTYAERVAWLHAMYEAVKAERDALLHPPAPLWPATGLEPRGCPLPGACSCPSEPSEALSLLAKADRLLNIASDATQTFPMVSIGHWQDEYRALLAAMAEGAR